jgi:hypothetical protein
LGANFGANLVIESTVSTQSLTNECLLKWL